MPYIEADTTTGRLRGIDNAGVRSFLGVPYGATTAGANRFRGPQPLQPWEGVRDALSFGPSAPQVDTRSHAAANGPKTLSLLYPRGGWPVEAAAMDEDCLRVNVWAPSEPASAGLPVLVWLHGGGFTHGSGNEMAFNGDILAQAGGLVVVTVTHRIGITGFLDLREHGLPDSANAGMLDIVAALEWIRDNIANFGGDPGNVTICGQSGGSGKVATLHAMPAAQPLFRRAVMMSGPFTHVARPAEAAGVRDRALSHLGAPDLDELRSLSLEQLLSAQARILAEGATRFGSAQLDRIPGFGPALDATQLPADPFSAEAIGLVAGKQLILGWTAHEAGLLLVDDPRYTTSMTPQQAIALLEEDEPGQGAAAYTELSREYPQEPPHLLWSRRISARIMRDPAMKIAAITAQAGVPTWTYQFDQTTEVLGGLLGACHSLDLAYVFGTVDRIPLTGRDPQRIEVSRQMMYAWSHFARHGSLGEAWRPWTHDGGQVHHFGSPLDSQVTDIDITAPLSDLPTSTAF
ncbi:carboxylesterase/lipase family protein [Gryllotalpicola koreensis]|uniref:Carboxylic ester hydrolase n=1 Tax=Gryllotalpicola koreensis TaxID=993086 RepID=A0ABP7ZRK4_9MICO